MVGILLVSHGKFGTELLKTAELIIGKQKDVKTLGLEQVDDIEILKEDVKKSIIELDQGNGVLVLADLFGGSPFNATASNMKNLKFKCLTGMNLPMLLEALISKEDGDLKELTVKCDEAGKEGIIKIEEIIKIEA